jgi:hypothetical protein
MAARSRRTRLAGKAFWVVTGGALAAFPLTSQAASTLPQFGDAAHLGVASCASSTCHGAATPAPGGTVLQNEYSTWQRQDKHAGAYAILLNEDSKRIARNLGLPAAETADLCLDCHADNPPPAQRGQAFQLTDGVGCESCHGGAENWIQLHTIGDNQNGHQRNIDAGLYPTADPESRARLCLSCHLGNQDKFVTHRIMGAGHPRLSFELDTFTAIEPAHFVVDDDYRERKPVFSGVQVWAIGQAIALAEALDGVTDPELGRSGLFPELSYFDCHACHKPMSAGTWQERPSLGLGPGVVRFNDANLIMLRTVAGVVSPSLAEQLTTQGRALHQANLESEEAWLEAADTLRQTALRAVEVFKQHEFTETDMRALLRALVEEGERGEYVDYVAAEQTTMAIGSVLSTMQQAGLIDDAESARVEQVMDQLYASVEEDERYAPGATLDALKRLQPATQ